MQLADLLEDFDSIIAISKSAPASQNRFVYYGDRIVKMPSPSSGIFSVIKKVFTEPIFEGVVPSVIEESFKVPRPAKLRDESIGSFLRRRFGPALADNLVSALFHGIYAGNIDRLSAKTLLPSAWFLERREAHEPYQRLVFQTLKLFFTARSLRKYRMIRARNIAMSGSAIDEQTESERTTSFGFGQKLSRLSEKIDTSSIYTFANGLQQFADLLIAKLTSNPSVTLSTSSPVSSISYNTEYRNFTITSPSGAHSSFDYAISTLRPSTLLSLISTTPNSLSLTPTTEAAFATTSASVNVMVVNLYYPSPSLLPTALSGFGYLIPASVPADSNPERALGVIFSSETSGIRGPESIKQVPYPTADELRSIRENLEEKMSSDYAIAQRRKLIDKYKKGLIKYDEEDQSVDQQDAPAHHSNWSEDAIRYAEMEVKVLEGQYKAQIDLVRRKEDEAIERESAPGFDAENNFYEVRRGQDSAPGTKLTVMLGGHWWDGWAESDLPTEEEGIAMAKSLLKRHIGITSEPEVAKARLQRDCIPQYPVGYRDYMADIHNNVLKKHFDGRLKVAGTWWQGGVGVNDCVRKARETAASIYEGWDQCTGLEEYMEDEKWVLVNKKTGEVEPDLRSIDPYL